MADSRVSRGIAIWDHMVSEETEEETGNLVENQEIFGLVLAKNGSETTFADRLENEGEKNEGEKNEGEKNEGEKNEGEKNRGRENIGEDEQRDKEETEAKEKKIKDLQQYIVLIFTATNNDSSRMRRLGIVILASRISDASELFGDPSEYPEITLV
ncbi:hypothetical protein GJ744_008164 [Endocarpon pusillum]|uniref:Uncharacterized protein n=1 Tax=Endocarpon pusillum TaxID=364733 RepID=A0A8H7AQE4_9EURO|nr:hypothetical protein GJ744_008164 [Endocarpon pusillum]